MCCTRGASPVVQKNTCDMIWDPLSFAEAMTRHQRKLWHMQWQVESEAIESHGKAMAEEAVYDIIGRGIDVEGNCTGKDRNQENDDIYSYIRLKYRCTCNSFESHGSQRAETISSLHHRWILFLSICSTARERLRLRFCINRSNSI